MPAESAQYLMYTLWHTATIHGPRLQKSIAVVVVVFQKEKMTKEGETFWVYLQNAKFGTAGQLFAKSYSRIKQVIF